MAARPKKPIAFRGTVQAGHKEAAVELPFDPATQWGIEPVSLWKGRNGHRVKGTIQGWDFQGVVVPRARRFWLILPPNLTRNGVLGEGDELRITVSPEL